jgi:DNA-binding transcriptional MocR family regulator
MRNLNNRSGMKRYESLAADMADSIRAGVLRPGDRLPSVRQAGPIFSAQRAFANCLRLNYGHPWDARSERAVATLGRIVTAAARG